jgi:O-antigen ligase
MLNRLQLDLYKWSLLKIFGYTCTATILYLYADALHTILYFHMPATALFSIAFMNHNFSLPLELHATYLSMFAALSITVFLYLFQTETVFKKRFIYLVCMLVLLAGMIQLSSRAAFIALLIILNVVFPFSIYPLKKRLSFFLIMSVFSAGILITIFSVDAFKTRYITELKGDLGRQTLNAENTEPRITRWKIVFGLARQSPFVGYGSGSETALLKKKYFEQHLYISYLNEFNSHSQYLSFLLKYGLLGLGIFVYLLIFVTNDALKKKDIVFLGFLTLIMVVSVSENVLDLNKGIFFYSFFISLFLIPGYKEKRLNRQPAGNQISTGSVLI